MQVRFLLGRQQENPCICKSAAILALSNSSEAISPINTFCCNNKFFRCLMNSNTNKSITIKETKNVAIATATKILASWVSINFQLSKSNS